MHQLHVYELYIFIVLFIIIISCTIGSPFILFPEFNICVCFYESTAGLDVLEKSPFKQAMFDQARWNMNHIN